MLATWGVRASKYANAQKKNTNQSTLITLSLSRLYNTVLTKQSSDILNGLFELMEEA